MLIDSHCHLDAEAFDHDREEVVNRARQAGVGAMLLPAYSCEHFVRLESVCQRYSMVDLTLWPAWGIHPCYVKQHNEDDLQRLEAWVSRSDCVAVGEIGLDRFLPESREPEVWRKQQHFFRYQLDLANRVGKPVVIHARHSYAELMSALRHCQVSAGGIIHAYNGPVNVAYTLVDAGFLLGLGGVLTQDSASRLAALVTRLPLSAMVLETDAPDMLPQALWRQGLRRHEPAWIVEVQARVAALRGISRGDVATATSANVQRCLGKLWLD
ncbi:MAG: TatD family hydrolase [Pseudomonadales bacterium]|nr:TatD family hydrolase [Pseudomonadales bacterium]